jgi:hypothetical protein
MSLDVVDQGSGERSGYWFLVSVSFSHLLYRVEADAQSSLSVS